MDHPRGCRRKAGAEWIHEGGNSYRCSVCGDYMIWPEVDLDEIEYGYSEDFSESVTGLSEIVTDDTAVMDCISMAIHAHVAPDKASYIQGPSAWEKGIANSVLVSLRKAGYLRTPDTTERKHNS